jgi:hypothetical protein
MNSRFSRVTARTSLAVGAAMVILPLTAGPASADPNPWQLAGGGFTSKEACIADAEDFIHEPRNGNFSEYKCLNNGGTWDLYVKPA